jgi:arsenical pump membrane protein
VLGVLNTPVGPAIGHLIPNHTTLLGLLGAAGVAAVLANLLNNLPATLVLVPMAGGHPALILAVLLGVNIGPNLTYVGSLANLLWRLVLHTRGQAPGVGEFVRLGAISVPIGLTLAVVSLWVALRMSTMA